MTLKMTRRTMIAGTFLVASVPAFAQETKKVIDLMGEVQVPVNPRRIIVTDGDEALQPVVALGIQPVGASRPSNTGSYSKWIIDRLPADMGYIGETYEPNYETVLGLEPDLIIMSNDDLPDLKGMYRRYSQIAPTFLVNTEPFLWRESLRSIAAVTGRAAEAKALLDRYDVRVAQVRAKLASSIGTATVARVRSNLVRYMLQDTSFTWSVLKDVGFRASSQQEISANDAYVNISLERLDILDAGLIILLEDEPAKGPGGMVEQIKDLPAFKALKGEILEMDSADFLFGHILTAFALLDFLEARAA